MITKNECAKYISFTCEAVCMSLQNVKDLFKDYEINVIDSFCKGSKERFLEVRFNTATLTCLFNENDICDGAYLFLDDVFDITCYIEYCNKTYPCSFTLKGWLINHCLVQITTENKECSLLAMPIVKQK